MSAEDNLLVLAGDPDEGYCGLCTFMYLERRLGQVWVGYHCRSHGNYLEDVSLPDTPMQVAAWAIDCARARPGRILDLSKPKLPAINALYQQLNDPAGREIRNDQQVAQLIDDTLFLPQSPVATPRPRASIRHAPHPG